MAQDPPFATVEPRPPISGLPSALTSFLGREEELARLRDLLRTPHIRLVTITGFGGIGKTRTAIEVVRSMAGDWHRIWFVPLAHVLEPGSATAAISRELGIDTDRSTTIDLQAAPCLLFLDNFEHLVDAASHILELLRTWPLLTILVTSRAPLNLSGEQVYALQPLRVDGDGEAGGAIKLFIDRTRAHIHGLCFTPADDPIIHDICQQLEGIPLAIELAAARMSMLTLTELGDRLTSQLSLLTGGPRDAPARQRTLRDTIAWSYNLLPPAEQHVLQGLSVFSGGFTLDRAARVLDLPPASLMDHLTALIVSSLVLPAPSLLIPAMRYRLLDPVREFAFEQLSMAGRVDVMHLAHARFFTAFAEAALPLYDGPGLPGALRATCAEVDNFRAAMTWSFEHGDGEDGIRLAGALWRLWPSRYMGGQEVWNDRLAEGRWWIERALEHTDNLPFSAVCEALIGRICLDAHLGIYHKLQEHAEALMARATDEHDAYAMYWAAYTLWRLALDSAQPIRDIETTLEHLTSFARRARQPENQEAMIYIKMGELLIMTNQMEEATPIIRRAHEVSLQCGNPLYISNAIQLLGDLALDQGNLASALRYLREGIRLQEPLGNRSYEFFTLLKVALVALRASRADLSLRLLASQPTQSHRSLQFDDLDQQRFLNELRAHVGSGAVDQALIAPVPLSEAQVTALLDELEAQLLMGPPDEISPQVASGLPMLTPREEAVLRLLAQGATNRTISDQLFISERTVENHVQHIFTKLEVSNRAGAAAWAVRHDLG